MNTPRPEHETRCAHYLKALGDPLRLQIIRALQAGPLSVSDLALLLEQEVGTTSHHLRVLYHADLVSTSKEGKFVYYSLSEQLLRDCAGQAVGVLDFGCCRLEMIRPPH